MRRLAVAFAAVIFAVCAIYIGMAFYYSDVFAANTWVNGIYCTGKTADEANAEILAVTDLPGVVRITGYGGTTWEIDTQDIGLEADYAEALRKHLRGRNSRRWLEYFWTRSEYHLSPTFTYCEDKLWEQWEEILSTAHGDEDYRIEYSAEEGYTLYDGRQNCLDDEKAFQVVTDALAAGEDSVDLVKAECYYDRQFSEEQEKLSVLWELIERFQSGGPVYDWGDGDEQPDRAVMAGFLLKEVREPFLPVLDENGCLQVVPELVEAYVDKLADGHDTEGKEWEFLSTRGNLVTVQGKKYGAVINRVKEKEWLRSYLDDLCAGNMLGNSNIKHIPVYTKESYFRGSNSLGGTYIEVDMGIQKLYFYQDGEIVLETDVVTGDMRRGRSTPEGVNYVYEKARNCVLRGPGYASPVSYWMPVNGGIGIHDANWRYQFGGDIYKTNGSHGCVNLPVDVMGELYDMVEVGMPVIMFYDDEEKSE